MMKAIKFTEETIDVIHTQTNLPTADLYAMLQNREDLKEKSYFVLGWKDLSGREHPWIEMRSDYFHEQFELSTLNRPDMFVPVVNK